MTWQIEKDESSASRRVIEFRTFKSDGTSVDTGSSNSSLRMSIGGNAQFTPNALVSAISANAGMYYYVLNQSDVSALGNHSLWYEGAFVQEVARVQVVNTNLFSNLSNIAVKAYSGVTFGAGDYAAKDMTSALTVGVGIAAPSAVTVRLSAMDYSSVVTTGVGIAAPSLVTVRLSAVDYSSVVTVGAGIAAPSKVTVQIQSNVYSGVSLRLDINAVPVGAFQANSIDNVAVKAGSYSGVTMGAGDYAAKDMSSSLTVGTGSIAKASYSGVTVGIDNIKNASYSGVTVSGVLSNVSADVQFLFGNSTAANLLLSHASSVKTGQAVAGVLSTTVMTTDVSWTTNDNFNGRVIVFVGGALDNQATSINSSSGYVGFSASSSKFNFAALTNAPVAGQQFTIV